MLNLLFFAVTFFYGARMIAFGVSIIKEKNYSGGVGLFVLSILTFAAAAVSAAEYFK